MDWSQAEGLPLALVARARAQEPHPFTRLLESRGYALLPAYSGREAVRQARETLPDLVTVDLVLQDMGSFDVCRALREDAGVGVGTPVVITAREALTRAQRLSALRAGAWECVGPESDPEELLLRVDNFVRARREAQTVARQATPIEETYHAARDRVITRFETQYLAWLLTRARGQIALAARIAGVDRTTLYRMLERHGLRRTTDGRFEGEHRPGADEPVQDGDREVRVEIP